MRLAAGCVLLSPYVPLLFMGEEYGEKSPFPHFVNHSDPRLIEAVRKGRKEEFAAFRWEGEPPDPQGEETFLSAKLDRSLRKTRENGKLHDFYKALIALRKENEALCRPDKESMDVEPVEREHILFVRRWKRLEEWAEVFHFGRKRASHRVALPEGRWIKRLDSADARWLGPGSLVGDRIDSGKEVHLDMQPESFVVLEKKE